MDIKVKGGQVVSGEIYPSGSKNSAVHILPASLMVKGTSIFENVPDITDVERMVQLLKKFECGVDWDKEKCKLSVDASNASFKNISSADLGNLKGTSLLWGPMLARFGRVDFRGLPGGCTLGVRPLDTHYIAFRDLGVVVNEGLDHALMDATNAKAREIWLNDQSPTGTSNAVMLATSLSGTTTIIGAACEPQVQDLCHFLVSCGAKIDGVGSSVLMVTGGGKLKGTTHRLLSDHYEITTFIAMAAATGGELRVHDAMPGKLQNIVNTFAKFNVKISYEGDTAFVKAGQSVDVVGRSKDQAMIIRAQPWPSLPVDTLPMFIALALSAKSGQVLFHNWMYEAGLFWTSELTKLGANVIMADPHRVLVTAGNKLRGAKLEAPYIIRAVVAMVVAAMVSEGESVILNGDALYRGHPDFAKNLKKLGVDIEEINRPSP